MPTVEERLISLEARVDAMSDLRILIAELRGDMNRRFDDVNRRVGALDTKVDRHFVWLMGMMVTGFITVIGALVGVVYRTT